MIYYEFEVVEGLEFVTEGELQLLPQPIEIIAIGKGKIVVAAPKVLPPTFFLSTAVSAYHLLTFPVPRPKALLGHQWMTQILAEANTILRTGGFTSLSIGAAGDDSSVFQRLHSELAEKLGLRVENERGDLHIRVRPSFATKGSWDVLIRMSPRPWATRAWRIHNMPGALNAPVASVMARLLPLTEGNRVLNTGCGSGTLLVEGEKVHRLAQWIGCDTDETALKFSRDHLAQADLRHVPILNADMSKLPLQPSSLDAIVCDLPFGQLVGDASSIKALYPAWLRNVSRTLKPTGTCIVITHAIKWFEECLRVERTSLKLTATYPIVLNGLHPRIYVIHKLQ